MRRILVLVWLCAASVVCADTLPPTQQTFVAFCSGAISQPCEVAGANYLAFQYDPTGAPISYSTTGSGFPTYDLTGISSTNLGDGLKASAQLTMSNFGADNTYYQLVAESLVRDVMTVFTADGLDGLFIPTFTINGSLFDSDGNPHWFTQVLSYADFTVSTRRSATERESENLQLLGGPQEFVATPRPFVSGQPFNMTLDLYTFVQIAPFLPPGAGGSLSGTVDFADTVRLTDIQILSRDGTPIDNWTISSGLGYSYTSQGVVPEPSSWLLLGTGLGLMGYFSKRRKK